MILPHIHSHKGGNVFHIPISRGKHSATTPPPPTFCALNKSPSFPQLVTPFPPVLPSSTHPGHQDSRHLTQQDPQAPWSRTSFRVGQLGHCVRESKVSGRSLRASIFFSGSLSSGGVSRKVPHIILTWASLSSLAMW